MIPSRTKAYLAFVATVLVLCTAAVAIGAGGRVDTFGAAGKGQPVTSDAPEWAATCLRAEPRKDRKLLYRCARVEGRVIWRKTKGRVGQHEVHLLLVARFDLLLAKLPASTRSPPSIADDVTVTGPLVRSRNGLKEVQVVTVD